MELQDVNERREPRAPLDPARQRGLQLVDDLGLGGQEAEALVLGGMMFKGG
jgi:hypothetical protein